MINFASVLVADKTDNIDENICFLTYWKPSESAATDFGGFPFKLLIMNTDFIKMCLKNATDEVNGSEVGESLKKEFFRKMTDVAIVLQKMERAKK